jgi:hypothetical protein
LSSGWWTVDNHGGKLFRWTDGNALLPLPAADGPVLLEIRANSVGLSHRPHHSRVALAA